MHSAAAEEKKANIPRSGKSICGRSLISCSSLLSSLSSQKSPLANFLQKRTELIEKTLNEAKEAKEAALKALQEVEGRLKTKDAEIEAILAAAKKSGEQERDRIIAESARLKDKILEQAKTNIEFELKHAKEVIKAEAVELAMELAEKKLKDKLTKEEQERLLDESLGEDRRQRLKQVKEANRYAKGIAEERRHRKGASGPYRT